MLFNFYNSKYSANLMKLVVYGQSDIDTLTKSVEEKFSDVKNNQYGKFKMAEPPYYDNVYNKMVKLVPVKDKRTLEMIWILDNQEQHYKNPPSRYVSHLMGHEGKGSLLSFLIKEGLATSLSAGGNDNYNCYSELEVTISLSDKGVKQIPKIIGYVFNYI